MSFRIERKKRRVDNFCEKTNRIQSRNFVDYHIFSPSGEFQETVSGKNIEAWKRKIKMLAKKQVVKI